MLFLCMRFQRTLPARYVLVILRIHDMDISTGERLYNGHLGHIVKCRL